MAKHRINEQQQKFIDHFVMTGNASESAEVAEYAHPKQRGYDLRKRFADEIMEATRENLSSAVPDLIKMAMKIALEEDNPKIKLSAIHDLLDRAGYKPVERTKTEVSHTETQSTAELEAELEELLGGDSLRLVQ